MGRSSGKSAAVIAYQCSSCQILTKAKVRFQKLNAHFMVKKSKDIHNIIGVALQTNRSNRQLKVCCLISRSYLICSLHIYHVIIVRKYKPRKRGRIVQVNLNNPMREQLLAKLKRYQLQNKADLAKLISESI